MNLSQPIIVDLVHESPVVRHGLAAMIRMSTQLKLGREAATADELLTAISDARPGVILASQPAGAEVLRRKRADRDLPLILVAVAFAAMSAILTKLSARSRTEAVFIANRTGMLHKAASSGGRDGPMSTKPVDVWDGAERRVRGA
ncbi:hypothetical protein LRH25_29265 [Ideonella azotifigens]|uniref:Response regulatory domain-containing protein n=1 Tax=Ideonella azotifigens TaxID=513160 RepID=A0ABN1K534_9BURK|nr:hypothetical protein [Ideonella azotifigens]MCD2344419.1 hypothetical protein [Ideonella azotifigens]